MNLTRRTFLKYGAAGLAAGVGGLGYGTLVEPERLSLERVNVPIPRLPDALAGLRIAVMSDFHLHPFTRLPHIQDAVRLANSLRPDLMVLLGDYVDSTPQAIYELAPELAKLNARLGVFGVLGNHDHWQGAGIVMNGMARSRIPMLLNSGVSLGVGSSQLFLAGLDSAWAGAPNLDNALTKQPPGAPSVLLMHEPDYADISSAAGRIALQLSGHSHGGQVRIPCIGALRLPSWGRRYDQGLYKVRDMSLYTNRGIGMVGFPVRFNCPPEVTEITLTPA